jgi:hypothetical protein
MTLWHGYSNLNRIQHMQPIQATLHHYYTNSTTLASQIQKDTIINHNNSNASTTERHSTHATDSTPSLPMPLPSLSSLPSLPSLPSSPLRTLVVILGNLRGGGKAWQTLYDHVLDSRINPHTDLALLIGDTRDAYRNASLFHHAKYTWHFDEHDDWADAMDSAIMHGSSAWRSRLIPLLHDQSILMGGMQGGHYRGSGAIIFTIRCYLMQKIHELGLLDQYDRFVITRSDHFYLCPHAFADLDPRYIWLPEGEDYGGISDRHVIVHRSHVMAALNILPPVLQHPEAYADVLGNVASNPEMLIARRWTEEGLVSHVRRFGRMMFTCGASGDATRWKALGGLVREGVQYKYVREYKASYATCGYCPRGRLWVLSSGRSFCISLRGMGMGISMSGSESRSSSTGNSVNNSSSNSSVINRRRLFMR